MFSESGFYTHDFIEFWSNRISETNSPPLIISGIGFDPRSMQSAKIISQLGIKPKIIPIKFYVQSYADNENILDEATNINYNLLEQFNTLTKPIDITMFDGNNRAIGGRQVVNSLFSQRNLLKGNVDVILDIGGLPRSLFAPLLSFLIDKQDILGFHNLHVASLPDENLDTEIVSDETLAPSNMFGFDVLQGSDKIVWIPIIGRNDPNRLRNIYSKIERNCIEICPVLPFRPNNPRLVDKLLFELHDVLFDEMRTIYNNIIYIDHRSPFSVYREIVDLSNYYKKLLDSLPNNVKVLISPLDDKTTCVGSVLAAVKNGLPIMYADTISYKIDNSSCLLNDIQSQPMEIWVSGEAYET